MIGSSDYGILLGTGLKYIRLLGSWIIYYPWKWRLDFRFISLPSHYTIITPLFCFVIRKRRQKS